MASEQHSSDGKVTRRTAVKGLAAAVAASGAPFIHASDKSGTKPPILGTGEYTYECHHGWGELPKGVSWFNTHGVTVDEAGLIYVKHQSRGAEPMDTIVVFDPDGKPVRSFGKEYHQGGHGIDLRKEGGEEFLYLCDTHQRQVVKTNLKGEVVWRLSYPEEAGVYQKLEQFRPTNVAFAPDGGFYVGDGYGSNYMHQYDKDAKWVRTWGGTGTDHGKFKTPHGNWLDDRQTRDTMLVVADRANARLEYYTPDGKYVETISDVLFPAHFDIQNNVLLVADLHARVSLFNVDNEAIVHLGDDPSWRAEVLKMQIRKDPSTWQAGKFIHPHDACFDKDGNIFVVEWVEAGRVTKLQKV